MTPRVGLLPGALLTMALLAATGCSKTEQAQQQAPAPAAAVPAPAPVVLESGRIARDGRVFTSEADEAAQREREAQLEARAAAADARARLAEIELQERTRRELERQELAARAEAARAAVLAEQARALDVENAALRARAYENEQRAIDAERAAYGSFGNGSNVIVVQPPQRQRPRPPQLPPQVPAPGHEPPPAGAGISIGLNRPAAPDLTPPGPPATFGGPKFANPKFDSMSARKPRDAESRSEAPN